MNKTTNTYHLLESKKKFGWNNVDKEKLRIILTNSGQKVLDVGCSSGQYVKTLLEKNFDAYGCDIISDSTWEKISKSRFKKADVYKLPYPDKFFDTVILLEVLEHLEDPTLAIKELIRISRKNIILSVPNCSVEDVFKETGILYYHYSDRTHLNFYTKDKIFNVLTKIKLKIDVFKYINPIMPEAFFLRTLGLPLKQVVVIGKIMQKVPYNKKYFTDMLIVASLKKV